MDVNPREKGIGQRAHDLWGSVQRARQSTGLSQWLAEPDQRPTVPFQNSTLNYLDMAIWPRTLEHARYHPCQCLLPTRPTPVSSFDESDHHLQTSTLFVSNKPTTRTMPPKWYPRTRQ